MLELNQHPELEVRQEQDRKRILIVDDEAIIRDLCAKALKGYHVLQAGDGEEAFHLFEKGGIDVILTDVMMPKMDGIELLKRLKEKEPTLVVIVMTGFAEKEIILNALKADADDFISKPLNLLQLKTAVDKALVKKALKEEIANLKNLDRLKSNFLSIISHKFRTPLTAISLFLQNLADGIYDPNDELFRGNLRLIFDEACYLERMVSDLLVFSRVMDTGSGLKRGPCSLTKIVHTILTESKEVASKSYVETVLDLDDIPVLTLDLEKITFAIRQVVDNAYKFSGEEGTVTISLKQANGACQLRVRDTGSGIPRDELPKIFEKFYQIDPSYTGQIRGFGLGLYYAREFVRRHGGAIVVESEEGQGTTATITLPLEETGSAAV
jgi:signal transduction histidine kinase